MSEFKFACPVCGQHIKSDSSASGTRIDCPTCFQKIVVPHAPADDTSKFILSATQAPGKRPVTEIAEAPVSGPRRLVWPQFLGATLAVVILAGVALALVKSGVLKLHPGAATGTQTNLIQEPAPAPATPDPRWRMDLADVHIPTNAASGRIWGRTFQLQRATIENGTMALRQGRTWPPDVGVTIVLPKRLAADYAGKRIFIPTNYARRSPRVVLRIKDDQQRPVSTSFGGGYAMRLEFGQIADGKLPGQIYLCIPDDAKSVVVGSFSAEIRQ